MNTIGREIIQERELIKPHPRDRGPSFRARGMAPVLSRVLLAAVLAGMSSDLLWTGACAWESGSCNVHVDFYKRPGMVDLGFGSTGIFLVLALSCCLRPPRQKDKAIPYYFNWQGQVDGRGLIPHYFNCLDSPIPY